MYTCTHHHRPGAGAATAHVGAGPAATRRARRVPAAAVAAALAAVLLGVGSGDASAAGRSDIATARAATARFHTTDHAMDAGYGPFPDGVPLHECIATHDGDGAMGIHWVNADLVDDTVLNPATPEVLVYAPKPNGKLRLVALEYVVFADRWAKEHGDAVPTLFGEELTLHSNNPDPGLDTNPYQIPEFWEIHTWVWKHNPAGMHAAFNPKVSCEGAA